MSKWRDNLVNFHQDKFERKRKYDLVKQLGGFPSDRRRMRDWRRAKIARWFGSQSYELLEQSLITKKVLEARNDKTH